MADDSELVRLAAAGNRFAVLDAFAAGMPDDVPALARRLGREEGRRLDGLLVLAAAEGEGDCRMLVFNTDGSRPEACGNGLRCVAKLAVERGYVQRDQLSVETDAGPRLVVVERNGGHVVAARAEMGVPRVIGLDETVAVGSTPLAVHLVDMGNPHCVLFVADVERAEVRELGPQLERHVRFRKGANVDFAHARASHLHVRTWERGVGETASCGTGASAAAVAALLTDRVQAPIEVHTRGGVLTVDWEGEGTTLSLAGPVE